MLQTWRFLTLLLAALGLIMGGAHVLELPVKMQYDAELYASVTSTLYRFFGLVGGPIQVAAILAAILLCFLVHKRSSFRLTLLGTFSLVLALALWFALVEPVNAEWLRVMKSASESIPAAYEQLRPRWECGHVAAFALWLTGFSVLLCSILKEAPPNRSNDQTTS